MPMTTLPLQVVEIQEGAWSICELEGPTRMEHAPPQRTCHCAILDELLFHSARYLPHNRCSWIARG
jgi:hypothetical protein